MLYLITGANGAGKTLNALKWVQDRAVKENRPVAHNGRFEPVPGGELANWKTIETKDWQAEPDGTIFLIDECHNDFPLRPPSSAPASYIQMLAEHRRRGFDFYLITQHPQNIDSFVRRLVGSPGWHRHLKRTFGADLVSVIEWASVNPNCEKPGSGKSGSVTMQAFPKEVYSWYRSASLHTGKKTIPKAVWYLGALAVAIPAVMWGAYSTLSKRLEKPVPVSASPSVLAAGVRGAVPVVAAVDTLPAYLDARTPRLPGLPQTAPIYDEVTKPKQAPFPAACVQMGKRCTCYSQQATVLHVEYSLCVQIVQKGFFVDWQDPAAHPGVQARAPESVREKPVTVAAAPGAVVHVPDAAPVVRSGTRSEWAAQLASRNASVQASR